MPRCTLHSALIWTVEYGKQKQCYIRSHWLNHKSKLNHYQIYFLQEQVDCWLRRDTEQQLSSVDSSELNLQDPELKTFRKICRLLRSDDKSSTFLTTGHQMSQYKTLLSVITDGEYNDLFTVVFFSSRLLSSSLDLIDLRLKEKWRFEIIRSDPQFNRNTSKTVHGSIYCTSWTRTVLLLHWQKNLGVSSVFTCWLHK